MADLMIFLSSRNQLCWGRWFVGALLPRPFWLFVTGEKFPCQLTLVMGVKAAAKSLLSWLVVLYYYKMRKDSNPLYIPQLMKTSSSDRWPEIVIYMHLGTHACENATIDRLKKQYKEDECVAVKITKLSILCYNSICSMCGCWWHVLPPLPLSYPEKENRWAQGKK